MSDIFISYSSEDKSRVQALARALERKGWSVWWDRRIPAGKSFDEVIHEALKAARSVVVVWTKTSVKSTWVKNESRSGLRRGVLFPVMLLDEVEIPLEFEHLQAAHLMDWQPGQEHAGFDQFIDDLAGVIGAPVISSAQPSLVEQSQEPASVRPSLTPEPDTERPRSAKVEPEPERWASEPSAATAGAVNSDSPRASFRSQAATEFLEIGQESGHVNDDRSSASTAEAPSTPSLPIFPIGIGLLAAIGALVYFVVFSQGPSPGKRNETPYQPPVQSPSTRTEVVTPPTAPEPIKQPSGVPTQTRPTVKRGGATADETVAAKPRPTASPAKDIIDKDGAPMVLIPAGEFMMGSRDNDESAQNDERPAHPVYLDAFSIDQYEVTTSRYAKFFQATNRAAPHYWSEQVLKRHGNKPVVGVDWNDATAYCAWTGKRLPTEAEWEKAARGTDQRVYPWGNASPSEQRANFSHCCDFKDYGALTDVGSYEAGKSPYGAYDMAGNVWEWVADWYDESYYGKSPDRNPKGPSAGQYRVLRGGSWVYVPVNVRSANRLWNSPSERYDRMRVPLCPGHTITFTL
ncbi:MAG: SUMF1/EgtB/PvdO family nonheme iron enzyme [Nitrospira sp.]|nr:SUMF1/EgtB/PvdO family nonheme iron enzyme [Nitrospira sp.]MDH4244213.1 SUMF1/EgtB/PvdO family nonheme iron enzyme [Nitrospira sp.]MDH4356748.1 SUMF1/EgtB/PvdO family nonheme iron enzyme [Nitrospira sp.]MDH5318443.1 SUMF1/EgtB/PvdO family nonheme iron enzyme [Nitrospira sp.]